jgi:CRP-like cAMP-binding protein
MFTVRALTQVHLFSLSRERFHKILHQKPELSARLAIMLLDTIGSQLSDMSERLAALERLKVMCESQI